MKSWLRQHRYAFGTTLRRLALQPFSTLTNIAVIALTLTVPLVGAALLTSLQPVTQQFSPQPQITLFLTPGLAAADGRATLARVQAEAESELLEVAWVPRDQAYARLRNQPAWQDALGALPDNPLPDAIIVTLQGGDAATQAPELAQRWQQWPGVDQVQLDREWIQRLQSLIQFAQLGLLLLAIGVAVIVLATVFNTVRMQALAQRDEITVARLVGATESFVRRPFLYQGALTAGIAALLSLLIAAIAVVFLNDALRGLAQSYGSDFLLRLPSWPLLIGFLVVVSGLGAFSARWSVTRNTRF
ncbi:MAG: ABC transporter permease [Pigmentiphaga sp.]|nr:ABC transporter permease [Pigmentiphaga sp.]